MVVERKVRREDLIANQSRLERGVKDAVFFERIQGVLRTLGRKSPLDP